MSSVGYDDTRATYAIRWKNEQYHREVKQTLGLEKCQRRSEKTQRNRIDCVILAWNRMTAFARSLTTNIYTSKERLPSNQMRQELVRPLVPTSAVRINQKIQNSALAEGGPRKS